jgi:hypothetical protein
MGTNYHTAYTTATLFHETEMNPPLSDLDAAITAQRSMMIDGGDIGWDSTVGTLSWTLPMKFLLVDPADGKMILNEMASGSITIPASRLAYVDLSTVNSATVSATYIALSTASTSLVPGTRFLLGHVNTALQFYPISLASPL